MRRFAEKWLKADSQRPPIGWALVAYALAYPAFNAAQTDSVSRIPTFDLPCPATILTGPRRSGRSLLGRTFCSRVHGTLIERAEAHDEEALFHAWNAAADSGRPLVLVADSPFEPALPDLRTRLAVTPVVAIGEPDDLLFKAIIRLLFADRGLHISDDGLDYLGVRVERSYWNAERIVESIDRFAIAERARLTVPTARRALAEGGLIDERGAA